MKTKELMIGDWVFYNHYKIPIQVQQITKKKIGYHIKPAEHKMRYARINEIEPIPITRDILNKNEFYFLKDEKVYFDLNLALKPIGLTGSYRIGNTAMIVNCAHELQHALMLCGIDKEIKI